MSELEEVRTRDRVLVVVDMQNDFIDGSLGTQEAKSIVTNVVLKIKGRKNNTKVVYTLDTHDKFDYLSSEEGQNLPVLHCIKGTPGWCLNDDVFRVLPKNSQCIEKNTFGSARLCCSGSLYNDPIIEVVGLCTDICVLANVVALKMGYPNAHIIVDAACCAGTSQENHDIALNAMKSLQVEIINQGKEPWRK